MTLWSSEFDPPNPSLTDDLLNAAQSELGVIFPDAYVTLRRGQNGGYVSERLVPVDTRNLPSALTGYVSDGYVSVGGIAGIGDGTDSLGDVRTTRYLTPEWGLPERLVLLDGDGHTWVALDYRNCSGNNPNAVFIESDSGATVQIASSFAELLTAFVQCEDVYDDELIT